MTYSRDGLFTAIRYYYEHNETRVFTFTRALDRTERTLAESASSISNWTEKTFLYCAEGEIFIEADWLVHVLLMSTCSLPDDTEADRSARCADSRIVPTGECIKRRQD